MHRPLPALLLALALLAEPALAQASDTARSVFPVDARIPTGSELTRELAGQVFDSEKVNGQAWHVRYDYFGNFVVSTNAGVQLSGGWSTRDGMLCSDGPKVDNRCYEVRIKGSDFYLKRGSGEIVRYQHTP